MALPVGIFSNAYRLTVPQKQRFWRANIAGHERLSRRQREREFGVPVWLEGEWAYAVEKFGEAGEYDVLASDYPRLTTFGLREALRLRAGELGWDAWFLMNEFHAVPPDQATMYGPVSVEPLLKARVSYEGVEQSEYVLVLASGVRWRMGGSLADPDLAAVAAGESVFRLSGDGPERGTVTRVEGNDLYLTVGREALDAPLPAANYSLVARPALVHSYLARTAGATEASRVYLSLLVASRTLLDNATPNRYAVKERFEDTEKLMEDFGWEFELPTTGQLQIARTPIEIFLGESKDLQEAEQVGDRWVGSVMRQPRLRFGEGVPSRSSEQAYGGLRRFGAYSLHEFPRGGARFLLVYPRTWKPYVELLRDKLFNGLGNYPGFTGLFGLPREFDVEIDEFVIEAEDGDTNSGTLYKRRLEEWARSRAHEPNLAIVVHPHSDRWQTDSAYYAGKVFFGRMNIPTQMVTTELVTDDRRVGWSLANIALASFAKLGGRPWVVDARGDDNDLVIGVGRADVRDGEGRRRIFGYAIAVISNGAYLDLSTFSPAVDEDEYRTKLTEAVEEALNTLGPDNRPDRVVIHLAKRTGKSEIDSVEKALDKAGWQGLPTAYLRVDDSSLFEFMDTRELTFAAPKGLAVRLAERRALVQTEGASNLGPARRPLLVELDHRSKVQPDELGRLTLQVFRLAHANWRGFNARSKPVTLFYGEQLAELVGYLAQASDWDPATLKPELRRRPWFL